MAETSKMPGAVGSQSRAMAEARTLQSQYLTSHYRHVSRNCKSTMLPNSQSPRIQDVLARIQRCAEDCRQAELVGNREALRQARIELFNSQHELVSLIVAQPQEVK